MSAPGMELVLTQAKALLIASMAAKVAALNSEYDDAYVLAAPDAASGYYVGLDLPSRSDFAKLSLPALCLCTWRSAPAEPRIGNEYEIEQGIVVGALVSAQDRVDQLFLTLRVTRAVIEILAAEESLDCGQCKYRGTDWRQRDLAPSKANYTLGSSVLAFAIVTHETP